MSVETSKPFASHPQRRFIKRPDDSRINAEINKIRKEIETLDLSINNFSKQIDQVEIDSATNSKRQELQNELKDLAAKQGAMKSERAAISKQIKVFEENVKRKVAEIQQQTGKNNFKSVKEIDIKISSLDKLVDSGSLSLAEERKTIKEMTALRKLKKDYSNIEKQQELIDQDKAKISELKKKQNSIQNKEVSARFETIQKQLDEIRTANQSIYDKKNKLVRKKNELKKEKYSKNETIIKLRSELNEEFTKFKQEMAEEKKKREEELRHQQEEEKKLKKKAFAEKKLQEASKPAFEEEISSIHNLLTYFDPSYVKPQPKKLGNGSFLINSNSIRTIEMPFNVVILKRQEELHVTGPSKKSKNKKSKAKGFTIAPDIIATLSDLSIPLPTKQDDVPHTITVLKETLAALSSKQDEQTKANIEKAKAKIAALEDADNVVEADSQEN